MQTKEKGKQTSERRAFVSCEFLHVLRREAKVEQGNKIRGIEMPMRIRSGNSLQNLIEEVALDAHGGEMTTKRSGKSRGHGVNAWVARTPTPDHFPHLPAVEGSNPG